LIFYLRLPWITIAIADEGRSGEDRLYGKIPNEPDQINKAMRKLISQNAQLHCAYEAGPCGYPLYRQCNGQVKTDTKLSNL